MENTTPSNPLLNSLMEAVNFHINTLIEARLKTINEAAITDYVQKAITARLGDTATNMQVMATLDTQLEAKITQMIDAAIYQHKDEEAHNTRDDIRNTVEGMDLTDKLSEKIESIVGDVDLSSNLESAIETYLDDHNYAKEEYVDEKMEGLTEDDGFTHAVKEVVCNMTFQTMATRY